MPLMKLTLRPGLNAQLTPLLIPLNAPATTPSDSTLVFPPLTFKFAVVLFDST